ncbi:GNAT family N-acetyltransferase [Lysobacter enzymogenes]|uniref:GNAT family N-acetyltransferase n=1 Tax=Lysobacter enzymogenes TaxID=69 RepID=UPI001A973968|nr:GNAT family N-acetyltransferase [Lysobacter enzymogenes]QQP97549.1 GNAT family N-acetyltransferase [Lysobacter enzymogenes]
MSAAASTGAIRPCRDDEADTILEIVNAAAEAYRGVIPADRWREPYMSAQDLRAEIAAGVAFSGFQADGALLGVMGIQAVREVDLIRHAYVRPGRQRSGVGATLLRHLREHAQRPVLVGTWADASWAIAFYRRNGFELAPPARADALLRRYWRIPERQIETSVVLELAGDRSGGQPDSTSGAASSQRSG